MMAPEQPSSSLAVLTAKEIEILSLLTAGHTVKSIAARLGRSEASINERLRDARRKTGIGSSRELARLLASQKNWDKKIDLPSNFALPDDPVQPLPAGAKRSKGIIFMLITMPLTAVGLFLAASDVEPQQALPAPAHAVAPRQPPLVGTWSLDVARIPADERPQRVTIAFHVSPDGKWTSEVEIVAPDGSSRHGESTAATDGVPVRITGNLGFVDTVSLRQPAPNTLVATFGKNGAPVSTRVYTVEKDRKAMKETIIWAGESIPKLETTYFTRID